LRALGAVAMATLLGPTPAGEGLRRCDELVTRADGARLVEAFAARARGCICSMTGEFERGREECRRSVEIYEELGHRISAIGVVCELERVERQSGRLDAAERELRAAYEQLLEIGDIGYVSWVAAMLARVLAERGAYREARELARRCREEMQQDHAFAQVVSRLGEAVALEGEGLTQAAEDVALEAYALVQETDMVDVRADVLLLLAELDRAAGRDELAYRRSEEALELYEQKGDVVSAACARARLAEG
jgi:tetratricopeptide (TPR) repeat protein